MYETNVQLSGQIPENSGQTGRSRGWQVSVYRVCTVDSDKETDRELCSSYVGYLMIRLTMRELLAELYFAPLHGIWQECMQLNMLQEKN